MQQEISLPGLDWKTLAAVCNVPNSDRRRHSDLFEGHWSEADLKDDERFYALLLERISDDLDFLVAFSRRFSDSPRTKDKERSFLIRVGKHLAARSGFDPAPESWPAFARMLIEHAPVFPSLSPEAELETLWLQLAHREMRDFVELVEGGDAPAEVGGAQAPCEVPAVRLADGSGESDWKLARDRIVELASGMDSPDPATADLIEEASRMLVASLSMRERAAAVRRSLLERIEKVSAVEPRVAGLAARAEREGLPGLASVADVLSGVEEELAAAAPVREAAESVRAELAELLSARNYARMGELSALAGEHERALAAHAARIDALLSGAASATDPAVMPASEGAPGMTAPEEGAEPGQRREPEETETAEETAEPAPAAVPEAETVADAPVAEGAAGPVAGADGTAPEADAAEVAETVPGTVEFVEKAVEVEETETVLETVGFVEDAAEVAGTAGLPDAGTLSAALAGYLADGEYALAAHLAALAEERGVDAGVPSAVLRALAVSSAVTGHYDPSHKTGELLSGAMQALEEAERDGGAVDRVRSLVFASLLRPALLDPDSIAREHMANLSPRGPLSAFSALQAEISKLGHDFRYSVEDFAAAAGTEREPRVPAAAQALSEWLAQARLAQSLYTPAHILLHRVLAPQGLIGEVIEAALAGERDAERRVRAIVDMLLDDRVAMEKFVVEREEEYGRLKRDRILGTALNWVCRKLQDGCEKLRDWLEAVEADRDRFDDRSRSSFASAAGAIRKAIAAVDSDDDFGGQGLDGAVMGVVHAAVADLARIVDGGAGDERPRRLSRVMNDPLLRLPGGCCPWFPEGDGAWEEEREAWSARLFAALLDPAANLSPDVVTALSARISEAAVLPARALLDEALRTGAVTGDAAAEAEQALAEREVVALAEARENVEALRLELATLYNLDLRTGDEVRRWLDRLDSTSRALARTSGDGVCVPAVDGQREPSVPADFPELALLLDGIREFRDGVRVQVQEDQRERLAAIAESRPDRAADVELLLASLAESDPVTVEDMIAQIHANMPVTVTEGESGDAFDAFFPGFVDAVADAGAETLNRGVVTRAVSEGRAAGPLDFSRLDEDARHSSAKLVELWGRSATAMKQSAGALRDPLRELMESFGFTSVKLTGDSQLVPGRLRRLQMRADMPAADRWFLPPAFGSQSGGSYQLFLTLSEVQDDQIAAELAKAGRDSPCILLVFGRLSRQRRQQFAQRMRRDKQTVLMVDETLVLFLATRGSERMQDLVACAAPFGYVQPYTTSAGNIPLEMFFGRRDEIAKIVSRRADGCLVYGGRQLGKSALLHHVRKSFHRPAEGRLVFYRSCDAIAKENVPADRIWREIAVLLSEEGICDARTADPVAVVSAVQSWLDAVPGRTILMLLDETDSFLSAEARSGFPNLVRLKNLMEGTERRFKVVFAGLHNVRRLSKAPNSPLVHLGDPICVGPLNTTPENGSAARRLVTDPMRAAGFDYAAPGLAWDILARVNHYPSLVQVFCQELLTDLYGQAPVLGKGPRWTLDRSQIFEGSSAQEIDRLIRQRFEWTLNLDPRYELVAKVLALYRHDHVGDDKVLRTGMTAAEIHAKASDWWPGNVEPLGLDDFVSFLDEMVDLGVLSRYGAKLDRYGLRSAQIAQMLGRREDLEEQILKLSEREPNVDYDAAFFHRRVKLDDPSLRAPLPDRALAALFDPAAALPRVFVAAPGLWGRDVADTLLALAEGLDGHDGPVEAVMHEGSQSALRDLVARRGRGRTVIVIPSSAKWDDRTLEWLSKQPSVLSGRVVPVCVADPSWLAALRTASGRGVPAVVVTPRLWGDAMLRVWMADRDLGSLDHRAVRAKLLAGTGGVPSFLEAARPVFVEAAGAGGSAADAILGRWLEGQSVNADDVGLPGNLVPVFEAVRDLAGDAEGMLPAEDVPVLLEAMKEVWKPAAPAPDMEAVLGLFAELGLLRMAGGVRDGVAVTPLGRLVGRAGAAR